MNNAFSAPPTVFNWIIANRDGMMLGALVAVGLVGLMLIARTVGHRMVAGESEATTIGWRTVICSHLLYWRPLHSVASLITVGV